MENQTETYKTSREHFKYEESQRLVRIKKEAKRNMLIGLTYISLSFAGVGLGGRTLNYQTQIDEQIKEQYGVLEERISDLQPQINRMNSIKASREYQDLIDYLDISSFQRDYLRISNELEMAFEEREELRRLNPEIKAREDAIAKTSPAILSLGFLGILGCTVGLFKVYKGLDDYLEADYREDRGIL